MRPVLAALLFLASPAPLLAQTCDISFFVQITQGAGPIQPGDTLEGGARFTTQGPSFRQEGGSTAHLATGEMRLGDGISGPIWTLIITSEGPAADLVGIYANDVQGFSVAGIDFAGPMALTLFGRPGTRPDAFPPTSQEDWDRLDLRRAFSLQAPLGRDMLAGDVRDVTVRCE